ncbi:MAG: tetratricopeptide repeat protein [Clostridia bacterium]
MDIKDLQQYLEKIDFNALRKNGIKLNEDDTFVGELYNSAIDNIKQENIDVAKIKLARVTRLDSTFDKAKILLEKLNSFSDDRSLGDKMEEALEKKDEGTKEKSKDKKITREIPKPEKEKSNENKPTQHRTIIPKIKIARKINPKISPIKFIKLLMTTIAVLLLIIIILVIILIAVKKSSGVYSKEPSVSASIEPNADAGYYESQISTLEAQALDHNNEISQYKSESENLKSRVALYHGVVLYKEEDYASAMIELDSISSAQAAVFSDDDKNLYNMTLSACKKQLSIEAYDSGNKLYQDLKYNTAYDNFLTIWNCYPDYDSIKIWADDSVYSNIVYDAVYKMARCANEIALYDKAIEGFTFITNSNTVFASTNVEGLIYHSAKAYAGAGNYEEAERLYTKLISEYPNSELISYAKDKLKAVREALGR